MSSLTQIGSQKRGKYFKAFLGNCEYSSLIPPQQVVASERLVAMWNVKPHDFVYIKNISCILKPKHDFYHHAWELENIGSLS